jgi:predicted phosphatase
MRDLIFKNLSSLDRKKRVITSSEIADNQGVRSIIRRHFIYIVKEIKDNQIRRPLPYLYVLKVRDTRGQKEKFFCRMKGSIYTLNNGRLFLVLFMHSLKITLTTVSVGLMEYNKGKEAT